MSEAFGGDTRLAALAAVVGPTNVLWRAEDKAASLTDWRGRYTGDALAVVRPGSVDDVQAVMRVASDHGICVVPQGGNSGLCAGATPMAAPRDALVLRLDRMKRVRWISPLGDCMAVDAGCVLQSVQHAAAGVDRLFPLSLGAEGSCQIGGNIATNAGGTTALRYGTTRDLVLGLEVVLADGRLLNLMTALRKNSTGYDLRNLFIGSEGTLGVITGAVLKLFPRPTSRSAAFIHVESIEEVLKLLALARDVCGESLATFEVMNHEQIAVIRDHKPNLRIPFDDAPWSVLLELKDFSTDGSCKNRLEVVLAEVMERGVVRDAVVAANEAQAEAFWAIRHSVSEASKAAGYVVSHDSVVPLFQQAQFVHDVEAAIRGVRPDARLAIHGHIGDGNLHVLAILPHGSDKAKQLSEAEAINEAVDAATMRLGGSISAEHGVGFANIKRMRAALPAVHLDMMLAAKQMLDPADIMNPGKLF